MSDFECPVVRIGAITKHPNADTLSLTEVEGCPVIIRTEDFKEGDLAVYLPIESLISETAPWVKAHAAHLKFKNGIHRLKAVRLRGIFSMGMVIPISVAVYLPGCSWLVRAGKDLDRVYDALGMDLAEKLGVTKYEEPEEILPEPRAAAPKTVLQRIIGFFRRLLGLQRKTRPRVFPVYGVSHYRKSKGVLVPGEEIVVTEKIHGTNFAAAYHKKRFIVSSHKVVRGSEDNSVYWKIARAAGLEELLRDELPGYVVYGEIFGPGVQDMTYDIQPGQLGFAVFDLYDIEAKRFLEEEEFRDTVEDLGLPTVPVLYQGPYDPAIVEPMADGISEVSGGGFREGIVIKPVESNGRGRIALKLVGETYLLRKGGTERH